MVRKFHKFVNDHMEHSFYDHRKVDEKGTTTAEIWTMMC